MEKYQSKFDLFQQLTIHVGDGLKLPNKELSIVRVD